MSKTELSADDRAELESKVEGLTERVNLLENLLDHTPIMVAAKDSEGRFTYCNQALATYLDTDSQQVIGHTEFDFVPFEIAEKLVSWEADVIESGTAATREEESIRKDGNNWMRTQTHKFPIIGESLGNSTLGIMISDISELKEVELKLIEGELKYKSLIENTGTGYLITEPDGTVIDANDELARMLGFADPTDMVGGNTRNWIVPESLETRDRTVAKADEEGSHAYMVAEYVRQDGDRITIEVHGGSIVIDNQYYIFGLVRDVTQRIKTERELDRHQRYLEQLVEERTRALLLVNEELKSFSYSVSHDLRAPLRSIAGFGQILSEDYRDVLDEQGRDYFDRMILGAKRMDLLIAQMLTMSATSTQEMVRQPVDLSLMVCELMDEMTSLDNERVIECHVEPNMNAVGDAVLLRTVLTNLIGNAFKFSGNEAVSKISVGRLSSQENPKQPFFVRDNGCGFNSQHEDKLFKPFQRLHGVDEFEGSGIGLANVARIVRRHGGEVWAESEEGQGATFYFTLGENRDDP